MHGFITRIKERKPNGDGFEREIYNRFGKEGFKDIFEGFMKLMQDNSVEEYQDEFEDTRIRLEGLISKLGESYFLFETHDEDDETYVPFSGCELAKL